MTADLKNDTGSFTPADVEAAPLPEQVSDADMELMLAFQQDITIAQRAYNNLMTRLAERYQLSQGDRINIDKTIIRGSNGERP